MSFKVGDKVRIKNDTEIHGGEEGIIIGVYDKRVVFDYIVKLNNGRSLAFYEGELKKLETQII